MGEHRACMRDHVRDAILARILDGTYPPGTWLREMSLAREFNVSQAPVREALRELEMLRLVVSERYRGTRVCSIDLEQLREAYELRAEIEGASARRATPCDPDDLAQLDAANRAMHRAIARKDDAAFVQLAVDFHRKIVQMSGNGLFLHAWEHLAWDVRARIAARHIGQLHYYMAEREAIVAALRAGEGVHAGELVRALVQRFRANLSDVEDTPPAPSPPARS